MLKNIKKTISDASDALKEQAQNVSDSLKEKSYALIEDWIKIFPSLENYGLKITSFGLSMGINPALNVELRGEIENFNTERLIQIIDENKGNQPLTTVFKAIKTTFDWHKRTRSEGEFDAVVLKLSVKLAPEVMVYLGTPKLI